MSLEENFALIADQFKTFSLKQKIAFIAFAAVMVLVATAYIGHFFYFKYKGAQLCQQVCISVGKGDASSRFITTEIKHKRKGCYCYDKYNNAVRWSDYDFMGYPVSKGAGVYSWFSSLFKPDE